MIREILYLDIPFIDNTECKKLGIVFTNKYNYLGYSINNKIVGVAGYKNFKSSSYLSCSFVDKQYRRQGIYTKLHNARMQYIALPAYANCTKYSIRFHLKNNNVSIIKQFKNGITRICYE